MNYHVAGNNTESNEKINRNNKRNNENLINEPSAQYNNFIIVNLDKKDVSMTIEH